MAISQSHVDALKLAIAKAQRRVKFPDGSEVEYRSIEEMREALAFLVAEVGTSVPATSFVISTTKGL